MTRPFLILAIAVCCAAAALAQEGDILDFAATHPLGGVVINPDGTYRAPKFGDHNLERAAGGLKDYPRPWTVPKILAWYKQAEGGKIRAHLLWVLAASKDPRAALTLGDALADNSIAVRLAATDGLFCYSVRAGGKGGTEQRIFEVKQWWEKNREGIQKEAERLRPKATPNDSFNRSGITLIVIQNLDAIR